LAKKILIVTEYFYPSNNSTSYYLTSIAEKLSEQHNVKVICSSNLDNNEELKNLEVVRIKESKLGKNGVFTRGLKFLLASIKLSILAYKNIKHDSYVLSVTNPAFIIIFLALLKKMKKFHCTLLVYDVFPENLIAANIIKNRSSYLYKIIKNIYDWSYKKADALIVIGRDMEEIIRKKTDNEIPISIIENWCDTNLVCSAEKDNNELINKHDLQKKKVFLFAGNLGRVQGIQNILEAAKEVQNKDFTLLLVGEGAMKNDIKIFIEQNPKNNIIYAGAYPSKKQNMFLNACDVAIVSLADNMYGLGVPSKSYYSMASGKPILFIGDKNSEIAKVVAENNIGWHVESENIHALTKMFENICQEDKLLISYGRKSRQVVEEKYSASVILSKYEIFFNELK